MQITDLLAFGVKNKASDLHLSAGMSPMIRVHGDIRRINLPEMSAEEVGNMVTSVMNDHQRKLFQQDLEVDFSFELPNVARFRVNAFTSNRGPAAVFRTIPSDVLTLEDLRAPRIFQKIADNPRGLVLVTGPTGSGKSTTMASMLDYRNHKMPGHIVTIEDPIEFIYKPRRSIFTQREVGIDTNDWKIAVQSAMRQAPDVVCIGEVRSEASMEYALQLAQTGHLCVFTIHANTAAQTIERIINFYQEDRRKQVLMDLALNLTGIIGQRLAIKKNRSQRTAVVDLLPNTPAMQDLIFKGELMEIRELMMRSGTDGMQTFDQHLFELYIQGQIEYDEALRQAVSTNDLRLRIQMHEEGNDPDRLYDRISDLNLIS